MARVLLVDDEESIVWAFRRYLEGRGHECKATASAEAAIELARGWSPEVVLLDVKLPGMDGVTALKPLRAAAPGAKVVLMTAHGTLDVAVQAVKQGATEYLTKPVDLERLGAALDAALGGDRASEEIQKLRGSEAAQGPIVGRTPAMQEIYRQMAAVSGTDSTVLVTGESGTGKELVARAIHHHGKRSNGPFEAINCGAIPETLVESELFGHELGAFTGAVREKPGKFEVASGGTLFLDEVSELSGPSQVKLLRFLEDRRGVRVGGTETYQSDVRLIAATNRTLEDLVRQGRFREDLYFRLNVVAIRLPALRERREDLPLLVARFLDLSRAAGVTSEALEVLSRHSWPGNVRELRHAVERGAVLARGGVLRPEHLPDAVRSSPPAVPDDLDAAVREVVERLAAVSTPGTVYGRAEGLWERALLANVLGKTQGNQLRAAELLGINRMTLKRKMDQYGL